MTDWRKRVWYEGREDPPHTGDVISEFTMMEDWRYTKTHSYSWLAIVDRKDLKVMMRNSTGTKLCIITYERLL